MPGFTPRSGSEPDHTYGLVARCIADAKAARQTADLPSRPLESALEEDSTRYGRASAPQPCAEIYSFCKALRALSSSEGFGCGFSAGLGGSDEHAVSKVRANIAMNHFFIATVLYSKDCVLESGHILNEGLTRAMDFYLQRL